MIFWHHDLYVHIIAGVPNIMLVLHAGIFEGNLQVILGGIY